ncbi:YveK family protein [Loigolactobacillus coryniformis subsp. coryniformis]|uniref:Capsular polysaccharide biosynthesis protein CpsC n=1 Tax=Loigolactobacillus coryniformis subsp. torquens DSM 20004 = KCTC 3535 TaxID=1423822 RepID=A0A2D1KN35_9LACO|nr:Wzz/FepE/Etk N-terminal domain-containing protein [Loigolactobacillus coryniformis]ATO43442.1 chain-length determining protein [Loigolactobacillus coryniformis subsp. torquens DSM 20004 = KCTC 3535]KRK77822.1 capsular polysaccharide synthesis enzyme Cap5A [Loigolactobacillus coryniformis subsp. torquens DSM 20004 = KCTC 3535]
MQQFSLKQLVKTVLKLWYIPLILALVGGFLSQRYAEKKYEPAYTAKTTVLVKQKHENSNHLQQQVDGELSLMGTYRDLINSNKVMTKVHKKLQQVKSYNGSVVDLKKKVTVETSSDSLMMHIQTTERSKQLAVKQANTIATVFKKQITTVSETSQVTLMTKAHIKSVSASEFSGKKAILYGVILGGVIGIFLELIIGGLLKRK